MPSVENRSTKSRTGAGVSTGASAVAKQGGKSSAGGRRPARENLKTIAFDSVGDRKYALQVQRAANGNPCLRLVEGVPQDDGSYRKFHLTVWSEDFDSLFAAMDEMRAFIREQGIRTPDGHQWKPHSAGRSKRR